MRSACAAAMPDLPGSDSYLNEDFQQQVSAWLVACFGAATALDQLDRTHRFLEEALELAQAAGCSREDALTLVDYVFSRSVGTVEAETGGVMVTLAGMAQAHEIDMVKAGEAELARNRRRTAQIREKRDRKPRNSPLPQ